MRRLEVILKLAEVCNIACTYCYYFFSGDDRFEDRPRHITEKTVEGVIAFANKSFLDGHIDELKIIFHGGGPLMVGKRRFEAICLALGTGLSVPHSLNITTNGKLLDEQLIALFAKWNVSACVSIDGPRHVHDRQRLDKRGRGTHAEAVRGLRLLQQACAEGLINQPAVLTVVDPQSDPEEVYNYLVGELGVRELEFLMPDCTWDSPAPPSSEVADYMDALMKRWIEDDDPMIRIRILRSVLSLWTSGRSYLSGFGVSQPLVMTIGSDGTIDTDDFLKPCGADVIATHQTIASAKFEDVFDSPAARLIRQALAVIPDDCEDCAFRDVCRGGQATHRYSRERGFNNRSIYCEAQSRLFERGLRHLMSTGVGSEQIAAPLRQLPPETQNRSG
jgi:uncharacterized protein